MAPHSDTLDVQARHRGGTGEPMVLVHGIGGSWRNWRPVLPALERRHDVLAVGLLGHHPQRAFAGGVAPSIAALVDGVEREMDDAGLSRAHLVGNSLGGWIVLELARRGRARSVVALSPGGGQRTGALYSDLTAARLLAEHRIVAAMSPGLAARLVRRPGVRRLLFGNTVARPEHIDATEGLLMLRSFGGADSFVALLRAMQRDGALADLDAIAAPVLIGWGTHDRVLPMRYFASRLREEIPGAEFRTLPGLGHVPMIDDPELVADVILGFAARFPLDRGPS